MFKQRSIQDIRALKFIYGICKILSIVPSYNFGQRSIVHPSRDKVQAVTWMAIILVSAACLSITKFMYIEHYVKSMVILECINELLLVMSCLSTMFSTCIFKQDLWKKINDSFQMVDEKLRNRNNFLTNFFQGINVRVFVIHFIYFVCIFNSCAAWLISGNNIPLRNLALIREIYTYYNLMLQVLIINLVMAYRRRYMNLNQVIRGNFSLLSPKEIGRLSRLLKGSIGMFNELFGWPLFFISGRSTVRILDGLNFAITNSTDTGYHLYQYMFLAGTLPAAFASSMNIMIMLACDYVTQESEKMVEMCRELQEKLDYHYVKNKEIVQLMKQIQYHSVKFSAAGFFHINRRALLAILGTATTYFIVLIQLNAG